MSNSPVEIGGYRFHYRLLTRGELRRLLEKYGGSQIFFEDAVCNQALVEPWPKNFPGFDECLAGVPTALAAHILNDSGFTDEGQEESVAKALSWIDTEEGRSDALICYCFASVPMEALDAMTVDAYNKHLVAASVLMKTFHNIDPQALLNPRFVATPPVDPEVMQAAQKMLDRKRRRGG